MRQTTYPSNITNLRPQSRSTMAQMAMAQPFNTHPGIGGHAGVAHGGQPMVHGHPSHQGVPGGQQPGVSMGQQIHPGITGPGGPQVSQAGPMMGGMMQGGGPPNVSGVGPSQHALSHLNPHQGQLYAQQHQQQQMQHVCKLHIPFRHAIMTCTLLLNHHDRLNDSDSASGAVLSVLKQQAYLHLSSTST